MSRDTRDSATVIHESAAAPTVATTKYVPKSKHTSKLPAWALRAVDKSSDRNGDIGSLQIALRVFTDYGGTAGLNKLIDRFERGIKGSQIAREFNVSKQRVSQWRKALGFVEEKYVVRDVVKKALANGFEMPKVD